MARTKVDLGEGEFVLLEFTCLLGDPFFGCFIAIAKQFKEIISSETTFIP